MLKEYKSRKIALRDMDSRDKKVLVTKAWRVLSFRMVERLAILEASANILNKQPRTADKGWSSGFGVGRGADNTQR